MSATPFAASAARVPSFLTLDALQQASLWLFIFSGWFVIVEPAPYEVLFVLTLALFAPVGLGIHRSSAPLIVFLIVFVVGGFMCLIPVISMPKTTQYFVTSFYMAAAAIFICFCITGDPMRRFGVIRNAWIWAAVVGATIGMIGYFKIAGMGPVWAPSWRAQGTFKDPNVLSTFLIPPAIFLVHGFLVGTQRHKFLSFAALSIIMAGIFLAFSRGAWINMAASLAMLFGLTFYVASSTALRTRIVLIAVLGAIGVVGALAFSLSFESIRSMVELRASLLQDYDSGEFGRFGNQLRSLSEVLESPNGFGPSGFRNHFGKDPHNVFLNAFVSYGWLGGISYILLCISTIFAGLKASVMRTPWQAYSIAAICPMISVIFQGIQIDTDHWRHFYLLMGIVWGLFAASMAYSPPATDQPRRP